MGIASAFMLLCMKRKVGEFKVSLCLNNDHNILIGAFLTTAQLQNYFAHFGHLPVRLCVCNNSTRAAMKNLSLSTTAALIIKFRYTQVHHNSKNKNIVQWRISYQ